MVFILQVSSPGTGQVLEDLLAYAGFFANVTVVLTIGNEALFGGMVTFSSPLGNKAYKWK